MPGFAKKWEWTKAPLNDVCYVLMAIFGYILQARTRESPTYSRAHHIILIHGPSSYILNVDFFFKAILSGELKECGLEGK